MQKVYAQQIYDRSSQLRMQPFHSMCQQPNFDMS